MTKIVIEKATFCQWCKNVIWPHEKRIYNPFLFGYECEDCYCGYGAWMNMHDFRGKHKRTKLYIYRFLLDREKASTHEIYAMLKDYRRSNQTMHVLCNILARSKYFVKVDWHDSTNLSGHRIKGVVWGLANE